jgi:hypothetical protein
MSTPFDFSGILNRATQAMDFRLGRMPTEAAQGDRAYREWLTNQEHNRGQDALKFQEQVYGREAANALSAYGINSQNVELANERNASIGNTAYGGSSPGGVEGAKLSSFAMPPPYTPPAYGPREATTTVNVSAPRANEGLYNPNEKLLSGWYNDNSNNSSFGYGQDESDAYGPRRRRR